MKALLFALVALLALGCSKTSEPPPPARGGKLEIVEAPAGIDVAAHVAAAVTAAKRDGKKLVVYVGAEWCEPCRYFHTAAETGQLDAQFGDLRIVELDLDRDGDALAAAGYRSQMIPLFALPLENGRASGKFIEGGVKGEQSIAHIAPRLRALVGD